MEETFAKAQQILANYGREVDGFNALRRDLTIIRVKALSKAGNDRGVKSIVISNAHLERGVSKSGIPVEENTYTVYNAVVFDVIMNIIGSQLPSTDYISGRDGSISIEQTSTTTRCLPWPWVCCSKTMH